MYEPVEYYMENDDGGVLFEMLPCYTIRILITNIEYLPIAFINLIYGINIEKEIFPNTS